MHLENFKNYNAYKHYKQTLIKLMDGNDFLVILLGTERSHHICVQPSNFYLFCNSNLLRGFHAKFHFIFIFPAQNYIISLSSVINHP